LSVRLPEKVVGNHHCSYELRLIRSQEPELIGLKENEMPKRGEKIFLASLYHIATKSSLRVM
jgi:hypothetical protein